MRLNTILLLVFYGNDPVPEVRLKGFYMPKYGAGRFFDKGKNYLGLVIMAVQKDGEWYADHDKPFRLLRERFFLIIGDTLLLFIFKNREH